jgi:hypothetical protein
MIFDDPLTQFESNYYDNIVDVDVIINNTDRINSHAITYYKYCHDIETHTSREYYENNSPDVINVFHSSTYNDDYVKNKGEIIYDEQCNEKYIRDVGKNNHIKSDIKIFFPTNFSKNIDVHRYYHIHYHINHAFIYNTCRPKYNTRMLPCHTHFLANKLQCQPKIIYMNATMKQYFYCDDITTHDKQQQITLLDTYAHMLVNNSNASMEYLFVENEKYKLKNKIHVLNKLYHDSIVSYKNSLCCIDYDNI